MTQQLLDTEEFEVVNELDISHLVTGDNTPVDSFRSVQQRADKLAEQLRAAGIDPDGV